MKRFGAKRNNAFAVVVLTCAVAVSFVPSITRAELGLASDMCKGWTPTEGYRYCLDVTFGFLTPGMCVGPATCLGLGTVAITGTAIGIGKGIVGKILGGGDSSGSGIPAGGIPLTGGSKAGCSGTPYIS